MTGKELKNSILRLAISGKLVPQDPTDEPASELLKRIRKEKERLVKEGKLKKKDLLSKPTSDYDICLQNHIHRLRSYYPLCTRYFLYFLMYNKSVGLIGGKGIGIQGLSATALHNILIPLPPLAEQHRIVTKIEKVFAEIAELTK